jgi:hypothetical protein
MQERQFHLPSGAIVTISEGGIGVIASSGTPTHIAARAVRASDRAGRVVTVSAAGHGQVQLTARTD